MGDKCCSKCGSLDRPLLLTAEGGTAKAGGRKHSYYYDYPATYVCNLCLMLDESEAEKDYERRRFTQVGVANEGSVLGGYYGSRCSCGRSSIITRTMNMCPSCMKESRMISKSEASAKKLMLETRQLIKLIKEKQNGAK